MIGGVSGKLTEVSNKLNEQAQMMRAMIDVSLVFTGTRGLTFLAAGHTHTWRSWGTQTME